MLVSEKTFDQIGKGYRVFNGRPSSRLCARHSHAACFHLGPPPGSMPRVGSASVGFNLLRTSAGDSSVNARVEGKPGFSPGVPTTRASPAGGGRGGNTSNVKKSNRFYEMYHIGENPCKALEKLRTNMWGVQSLLANKNHICI